MLKEQKIILTDSQTQGVEKLRKFLLSSERIFLLIGPAGSGKTTMIKTALEDLIKDEVKGKRNTMQVAGITLAHQAKKVLSGSIPNCFTFASAFGYKEHISETGQRTFVPNKFLKEDPIGHFPIKVFVHDECSMYTYDMVKLVQDKTSIFSKIIYMGDKAQLPPIDDKMKIDEDSPTFNLPIPDWCKHELTERVRQKEGNPILDLADAIREEIFGKQNLHRIINVIMTPKIHDNTGYMIIKQEEAYERYLDSKNFLLEKLIAFRNAPVSYYNSLLRNKIFPNAEEPVIEGDLLFMNNNYMVPNTPFPVYIENSEQFFVDSSIKKNISIGNHGNFKSLKIYPFKEDHMRYLIYPSSNGLKDYVFKHDELLQKAKANGKNWKEYYSFKDSFAEFTYGYSVNAYKCQGSTYHTVYIDLIDILTVGPLTNKRKLQTLYTAVTRPTNYSFFIHKS